jgi:hypothetical protein
MLPHNLQLQELDAKRLNVLLIILLVYPPCTFRMHGSPRSHHIRVEHIDMHPYVFGRDRNVTRSRKPHHPAGIKRRPRIGRDRLQRRPIRSQFLGSRRLHSPAHLQTASILTEVTLSVGGETPDNRWEWHPTLSSTSQSHSQSFFEISTVQPP